MSKVGLLFKHNLNNLCLIFRIIKNNNNILTNIQTQDKIIKRIVCIMDNSFKDHALIIPILRTIKMVGENSVCRLIF